MKPIIGVTMGDPAGIGAEIAVKALSYPAIYGSCVPVVIGDDAAVRDAIRFCGSPLVINTIGSPERAQDAYGALNLIDLGLLKPRGWEYKKVSALCGKAAFTYIDEAIRLAMAGKIHAVATGPISKEAINKAGYHYSGHTEIFAEKTNAKNYAMLLMYGSFRVIHVTAHVSVRGACGLITKERVLNTIRLAWESTLLIGVPRPRIAVAGFNPHAGENGLFGDEEAKAIAPAIEDARSEGITADGPIPPDTVFVKALAGQYDIVVAMYHDQGHIPVKLIGFKPDGNTDNYASVGGVNCTAGLPIIRTSVDHGTAFDRAGENRANEESLVEAIMAAAQMAKLKYSL